MKNLKLTILFLLIPLVVLAGQIDSPKVKLLFNKYYDYDELIAAFEQVQKAYPDLTSMTNIGKSFEGRDMWVMTIHNPKNGPHEKKPAIWVDGNIHGNEVQGGETCLYLAWYLLENYGSNDRITAVVDRAVFYILPVVNPDGRAYWFREANTSSSSRSGQKPTDNDRDGVFDEDGPNDLDGDGNITTMRKKDPNGRWKLDPEDSRLMIRVGAGEKGDYSRLGSEGIDDDGDGQINEDGAGGYDPNRNWGFNWMPDYIQGGAEEYPFSLPESQNIRDFMVNHPNIIGAQSYHNTGGMILRGPGANNRGEYPRQDVLVYDYIGKLGEKMLPHYRYMIIWKDLYTVYGGSVNWMTSSLGAFAFSNELDYRGREDITGDAQADEKERLKFDDYLRFGSGYKEWEEFDHPVYGKIEIGGWTKFTSRVPPSFFLEETLHRNAAFAIFHAENLPEIDFQDVKVENLGGGLFKIDAVIENKRSIPTRSALAVKNKIGRRDLVTIEGAGVEIVTVAEVKDHYLNINAVKEKDPEHYWIQALGGNSVVRLQWLVKGNGKATIVYNSEKGGVIRNAIVLK